MSKFIAHRCHLYHPSTSAIQVIAFDENLQKLALARSDGRIELWDTRRHFSRQLTFSPASNSSVESIVWCKGRLHVCGTDGFLRIYSIHKLFPIFELKVSASAIWCCVKCPTDTHLAVGTEDGTVSLLHVDNDLGVQYDKTLVRTDKRILCLSWHEDGVILAGGSLEVIRLWNVETGRCLQRITVPRNPGNAETVIWAVLLLKDMTLVSGDSRGRTSFWNGRNGTLINSYESHKADVLTVIYDKSSGVFYSSGIEPVVCQYACIDEKAPSRSDNYPGDIQPVKRLKSEKIYRKSFVEGTRRYHVHSHDVRSMVFVNDWLVTGGVDTFLGLSKYPPNTVVRIAPFNPDKIQFVPFGDEVLFTHENRCEIWRLGGTNGEAGYTNGELLRLDKEPVKLIEITAKEGMWISCSAISFSGNYLAYSDGRQTTIYKLELAQENLNETVPKKLCPQPLVSRVKCLNGDIQGGNVLCYCYFENVDRLIVASSNSFNLFSMNDLFCKFDGEMKFEDDFIVTKMCAFRSNRFSIAFVSSEADVILVDFETNRIVAKLPRTAAIPVDLCFSPFNDDLLVLYSDGSLVEYSTKLCKYTGFSRNYLCKFSEICPFKLPPLGIAVSTVEAETIFVYSSTELYLLRRQESNKKRDDSGRLWNRRNDSYNGLCKFGCLKNGDVVAVEIPNAEYVKRLPPVLNVRRFGTG